MSRSDEASPRACLHLRRRLEDSARMTITDELKEVVATFRPLVQSEETRSNNLNTRAAAVLSASGIVTTVLGFFAKDLYTENYKTFSAWFEWVVVLLLIAALFALLGTALCCLKVLLPR